MRMLFICALQVVCFCYYHVAVAKLEGVSARIGMGMSKYFEESPNNENKNKQSKQAIAKHNDISARIGRAVSKYFDGGLDNEHKNKQLKKSIQDIETFCNIITNIISDSAHSIQLTNTARDRACLRKLKTEYENLLDYIESYKKTNDKELISAYIHDCLYDIQFVTSHENTTGISYQTEKSIHATKNTTLHNDNGSALLLDSIEDVFCEKLKNL